MAAEAEQPAGDESVHQLALYASDVIAAYVAHNPIPAAELPGLIASVHATLRRLSDSGVAEPAAKAKVIQRPSSAEIRKSIGRDGLVSFIDGKVYKTLKRHLTSHGLDPIAYRERYGLPEDYPMVAPSYAERRSALAKEIGLGRPGALAARQTSRDAA
ncbi:MucR family transcriptional regulator [Methylobacterium aerolatum]|uniref:MucR family transcriptional regulator n=1 Tax=Methylobacterium aerolatum TaxID=418708 RepID=UPI001EE0E80D|nr:MucR family transcriptional regulator [Methylobacterium aerolatum]GJD33854.1 Transcriptional regulatory protein ros [Methylobacterium aerolatum]